VRGLAPRAPRNCAPSAPWGASVRPLNFTVRPPLTVATSQNLRWLSAVRREDSGDHRPGRFFAETLRRTLLTAGWQVDTPTDWRDVGWVISARKDEASISISLARLGDGHDWMLQIAPQNVAGPIGRLFGGVNSATPSDVLAVAHAVHSSLSTLEGVSLMQWRWDGMPRDNNSSPQPAAV
jgi:hypothetical protein